VVVLFLFHQLPPVDLVVGDVVDDLLFPKRDDEDPEYVLLLLGDVVIGVDFRVDPPNNLEEDLENEDFGDDLKVEDLDEDDLKDDLPEKLRPPLKDPDLHQTEDNRNMIDMNTNITFFKLVPQD
jgi:hypothetical protein